MGKEFKNIDELFQTELGGEMHVAPDFIKTNIDKSLGFQSKRRGFFILGSIAAIGIIFTTAMFINQQPDRKLTDNIETPKGETPLTLDTESKRKLAENHLKIHSNEAEMNVLFAVNRNNSAHHTNSIPLNSQFNNNPTSREISQNIDIAQLDQATIVIPNKKLVRVIQQSAIKTKTKSKSEDKSSTPIKKEEDIAKSDVIQPTIEITSLPIDGSEKEIEETTVNDSENEPLATESQMPESIKLEASDTIQMSVYPTRTGISEGSLIEKDSALADEVTLIELPIPIIYKPWTLSLTSGINRVNTAYTADKMSDKTIYENAAIDLLGYQSNFDFTYRLKNGLTFGSGLGYSTFKEQFEFKQSILETKTIKDIQYDFDYVYEYDTDYTFDTAGVVIDSAVFISDSTYSIVDSSAVYSVDKNVREESVNGENRVTYFHIPLSFGTQIRFNKFELDLFANLRFNFRMQSSGVFKKNDVVYAFNETNSIYKRFYTDVVLGSKVHYNIWNNLYLTGTVQYRPVMGTAYKNVPFNKSFDYLHLGIGFSIRL